MSFAEQVRSLQSAEIVIGLHGAALTNIIFCQEHTLIIELRSSMFPPEFYSIIARAYNLRFEAIQLKPEHKLNKQHLANKENLIITEEDRNLLFSKIRNYE